MSVKEVLKAVRALTSKQRAQTRALLDALPDAPLSSQEEAPVRLRAAGLLAETSRRSAAGRMRHSSVEIKGKPLPWTIVNERR